MGLVFFRTSQEVEMIGDLVALEVLWADVCRSSRYRGADVLSQPPVDWIFSGLRCSHLEFPWGWCHVQPWFFILLVLCSKTV